MASPGALNLSIVSLGGKDPFIRESGFPELMIHIGGQDKMRFFLHQFKNLLIKRERLWLNSVQICMFGMEAMKERHSVRQYTDQTLDEEVIRLLTEEIDACNQESGLHIQLVKNEPKAFDSFMAHYGKFSGVTNYIAMVGKKGPALEETCGYYGERLVLKAQQLGLNTCWVAMTYSKVKSAYSVDAGEKLCIVISLGYGKNQGVPHKSKSVDQVAKADGPMPDWFRSGVEASLLAPTAMNQQKYQFTLNGKIVSARVGMGFYSKIDLGIVKYHFELGAGRENFSWI